MKKSNEELMTAGWNKKQQISVQELDQLFDEESDEIDTYINWAQAKPGLVIKPGQQVTLQALLNGKFFSRKNHIMGEVKNRARSHKKTSSLKSECYQDKSVLASVRKSVQEFFHSEIHS